MSILDRFKGEPSDDELERKLEKLKLMNQVEQEQYKSEEYKGMIKEIRAKYGKGWRQKLGIQGKDGEKNGTLAQFANARFKM